MLDCIRNIKAEERHKALGIGTEHYYDLISVHRLRVQNGRSCRGCVYQQECLNNPERIIFLQSIARSPYCDFLDDMLFLKLTDDKAEIKELKKVVKQLKKEVKANGKETET